LRREFWDNISEVLKVVYEEGVLGVKFQNSVECNTGTSEVLREIIENGELEVKFENGIMG